LPKKKFFKDVEEVISALGVVGHTHAIRED
jgi:hypothetical protein